MQYELYYYIQVKDRIFDCSESVSEKMYKKLDMACIKLAEEEIKHGRCFTDNPKLLMSALKRAINEVNKVFQQGLC